MLRCFLLVLLSLYAVLPPGICACRLEAALWAALTEERLPDCIDDPYEHDHHCPGAKKQFIPCDQPSAEDPRISTAVIVDTVTPPAIPTVAPTAAIVSPDFDRPPIILIVCPLRI